MTKVFTLLFGLLVWSAQGQIRPDDHDWISYDLTTGIWLNSPADLEIRPRSNHHTLSLMSDIRIGGPLHLGFGLAYSSENWHSNISVQSDRQSGIESYGYWTDDEFQFNKINAKYLELPVELRLQTRSNSSGNFWRLVLGFRGGVRIRGYATFENENFRQRLERLGDLNRWKAGLYTRIGYDWFNLYGYYGLNSLFDAGELEGFDLSQAQTLNFGISITP